METLLQSLELLQTGIDFYQDLQKERPETLDKFQRYLKYYSATLQALGDSVDTPGASAAVTAVAKIVDECRQQLDKASKRNILQAAFRMRDELEFVAQAEPELERYLSILIGHSVASLHKPSPLLGASAAQPEVAPDNPDYALLTNQSRRIGIKLSPRSLEAAKAQSAQLALARAARRWQAVVPTVMQAEQVGDARVKEALKSLGGARDELHTAVRSDRDAAEAEVLREYADGRWSLQGCVRRRFQVPKDLQPAVDRFVVRIYDRLAAAAAAADPACAADPEPRRMLAELEDLLTNGSILIACPVTCLPFSNSDPRQRPLAFANEECRHTVAAAALADPEGTRTCPVCGLESAEPPKLSKAALDRAEALERRDLSPITLPPVIPAAELSTGDLICAGAQGTVFRGTWTPPGREPLAVAIKVTPAATARERRALRENLSLYNIATSNAPHVCLLLGHCFDATGGHGTTLRTVMELCPASLQGRVDGGGPLPAAEAARVGYVLASTLAALHAVHIWHLDVKPANVLFTASGDVRLADFGIAQRAATQVTRDLAVSTGTRDYAPPEQAAGAAVGAFSDVYSLGLTLAYAAAGGVPRTSGAAAGWLGSGRGLAPIAAAMAAEDPRARPTMAEAATRLRTLHADLLAAVSGGGGGGSGGRGSGESPRLVYSPQVPAPALEGRARTDSARAAVSPTIPAAPASAAAEPACADLLAVLRFLHADLDPPDATAATLPTLRSLHLAHAPFGPRGLALLLQALPLLPRLESLHLVDCGLGAEGAAALARALARAPALTELDLSSNGVAAGGPAEATVRRSLGECPKLERLSLDERPAPPPDATVTVGVLLDRASKGPEQPPQKTTVEDAFQTLHKLGDPAAFARPAAASPPDLDRVTALHLTDACLGADGEARLAAALPALPVLRELHLAGNCIGAAGARALAGVLGAVTALEMLDVGRNAVGEAGAAALAAALPALTRLRTLAAGDNGAKAGAAALAEALPTCLQALDLSKNGLQDDEAAALAVATGKLPQLQAISVACNHLGPYGMCTFASALEKATQLTSLRICGNGLGPLGTEKVLVGSLRHVPLLAELHACENGLGPAGAAALARALVATPRLTSLALSKNALAGDGAWEVASALRHLPALRELLLVDNGVPDTGARAIAQALRHVTDLRVLDLRQNPVKSSGASQLLEALPRVPKLERLSLWGREFAGNGTAIAAELQAHMAAQKPSVGCRVVESIMRDCSKYGYR